MKRSLLALAAAAAVLGVSVTQSSADPAGPALERLPRAVKPGELSLYGHIKTLTRKGNRFEFRFDPALWLTGVTASRAAFEDTGSSDVPNDYYIRDESHKLLTYVVPATARVTILLQGIRPVRITVAELAQIRKGKNPNYRRIFDTANGLGFWILVDADRVRSLDQQYQP